MARRGARRLAVIPSLAVFVCGAGTVEAQVPAGSVFQVNTYTTGAQAPVGFARATAAAPDGRFVSVWASTDQDGSGNGVFAQRFDAAGFREGPEFRVNTHTQYDQMSATVAVGRRGEFVVAWQDSRQDGNGWGVFAQRYDSLGAPAGGEFQVNSTTLRDQRRKLHRRLVVPSPRR
jgi:hypothetical protein